MKTYIFFLQIGVILLFSFPASAEPPPKELWVARYNSGWGGCTPGALAVDGSGNVYVTGNSRWQPDPESPELMDYVTIKYDLNGNKIWAVRYDEGARDIATALAVDDWGNVYVTGYSGMINEEDYATVKYDQNGNQLWVARYDYGGNTSWNHAYAMRVDDLGNVCITGTTLYGYFGLTIKYDVDGKELWIADYNGGIGNDGFYDLFIDNSRNVYVAGYSVSDYAIIKYDPNGNQLWVARYNGPGNGQDAANSLAVDNSGNVYVTGWSDDVNHLSDYATVKYDINGNQLWVARYNGPGNDHDFASALDVDNLGNVYVAGTSDGDYATIKYDSEGNELWVARHNEGSASALAVDDSGNVYVTGIEWSNGKGDYATVKYDPNGKQLWVARYNGPGNEWDSATVLAIDDSGNIYLTGESEGNYATIKYTQCLSSIAGDIDDDCEVDFGDFATFALSWVGNDLTDLAIIAEAWLECTWSAPEACW